MDRSDKCKNYIYARHVNAMKNLFSKFYIRKTAISLVSPVLWKSILYQKKVHINSIPEQMLWSILWQNMKKEAVGSQ